MSTMHTNYRTSCTRISSTTPYAQATSLLSRKMGRVLMSFALSLLLVMTPVLTFTTPKAEGQTGVSAEVANNGNVTTSAKVITVSNAQEGQAPLSATVTYDSNFVKGQKTRFTYNVMGNTNPLMFRLYSFCIKKDGVWNDVIDISKSPFNRYSTTNYFEECLYSAGTYRLDFNAMEYEDNGDGTKKLSNITRFQIEFSIAESEGSRQLTRPFQESPSNARKPALPPVIQVSTLMLFGLTTGS